MELEIENLTKQYGNKMAIQNVSCTLKPGVVGLLGANGAGKSTLMRMICGVMKPTSGKVRLGKYDVTDMGYRNLLGYLSQDFGYYPDFTGMEFLLYVAALKGLDKKTAKERSENLLEQVNLEKDAKRKVKTYSGGMKRRLGIAQTLLNDPTVFNRNVYWGIFTALMILGVIKIVMSQLKAIKGKKVLQIGSMVINIVAVIFLALARETYATVLIFLLFLMKGILAAKGRVLDI